MATARRAAGKSPSPASKPSPMRPSALGVHRRKKTCRREERRSTGCTGQVWAIRCSVHVRIRDFDSGIKVGPAAGEHLRRPPGRREQPVTMTAAPGLSARCVMASSIFCWKSTAIIWPSSPTIFAAAIESNPMPLPPAMTLIRRSTSGLRFFSGLRSRRRSGLSIKHPPHQGHACGMAGLPNSHRLP